MAIGERIRFFRLKRGMTQKYLGQAIGFPEKSADVRLAQYETGTRTPKREIASALADILDVSPQALMIPEIDSYTGLMHTLFALEDIYGLNIFEVNGEVCLRIDRSCGKDALALHKMLCAWLEQNKRLQTGELSKEAYDRWRYRFPELDTTQNWVKTPSQGLSDLLVDALTDDSV